jgi:multiple sugar transport system permease protein
MIMTALWRTIGFSMLIYLSGLTALPREIREAATLDGSSGFHLLKNVTLPLLKPFTAVVLAWNMLGALTIFDYVQVMTAGGPARMSETLAVSMYRESFMLSHYGSGAAIAIVLFLLVIIVVVSLLHFSMKRELKY